jgi:type I restriction enzyme R subunit
MVMTRGKDDPEDMYYLLGTKRSQELDRQFKRKNLNFRNNYCGRHVANRF